MNNGVSSVWGPTFGTPRVFINHMDSYHGKALSRNLLNYPGTNPGVLDPLNKEDFLKELLSCNLVIYDITLDDGQIREAEWALEAIANALESSECPSDNPVSLHFLLISPVMTWACTRQLDSQNLNAPLNELDYRKRVPHSNFRSHKDSETRVMLMKDRLMLQKKVEKILKTLVLCCGVTYGNEEGPLHFLFKLAWHNSPFLPVFGPGDNKIPLLHVDDLSRIVHSLFHNWPEDRWYLVATELDVISQTTIVQSISRHMSNGEVKSIEKLENSIFKGNISQRDLDVLTLDVNIEPAFTLDHNLQSERTFDMQVERIVDEYRASRNLRPVKIIILGPPATGKTTVAHIISQYYRIPYISEASLITEAITNLPTSTEEEGSLGVKTSEYSKGRDNEGDEKQRVVVASQGFSSKPPSELQRQLDEIRNNLSLNNDQATDAIMNKLLKTKLETSECANQGYVLDGYPKTRNEACELFTNKLPQPANSYHPEILKIFPEFVIQLEASDEFLYNRVLNLSESVILGTHYDAESTMRRLGEYRKINTGNDATLGFFIENGIHPLIVDVEGESPSFLAIFRICLETIGQPRNYGASSSD